MSASPLAARSKMMVLLFLSQPSGQLFFLQGRCMQQGWAQQGIRKIGSALSFLPCFKVLFLSAAKPTYQGEESVLLLLVIVVGGGHFSSSHAQFLGV